MWKIKYPQYHQISFYSVTPISKRSCHSFSHLEKKKKDTHFSLFHVLQLLRHFSASFNSENFLKEFTISNSPFQPSWAHSKQTSPPRESHFSESQCPRITKPNRHFQSSPDFIHQGDCHRWPLLPPRKLLHLVPTNICGCTLILLATSKILPNIACGHTYSMKNTSVE